ncbi:cytochrome c family protein [Desulfonatronospira sp.]|uniref:cytochrome c family protein n=1 Tax=Desulfonatronospira sp. TaxID=1962951 RepID=UPI0025C28AE1|nr:cytochrome c family protein [Desulfonatronospira sp.]
MKHLLILFWAALAVMLGLSLSMGNTFEKEYVGSDACKGCHVQEYDNFMQYASKSKSDENVQLMMDKLTPEEQRECFECHTTGYGEPGGFISFEETPEMGHAGCEVCHGPGSEHAFTGDPYLIEADLTIEEHCAPCHDDDRVRNINYKPLLYSGAH